MKNKTFMPWGKQKLLLMWRDFCYASYDSAGRKQLWDFLLPSYLVLAASKDGDVGRCQVYFSNNCL